MFTFQTYSFINFVYQYYYYTIVLQDKEVGIILLIGY